MDVVYYNGYPATPIPQSIQDDYPYLVLAHNAYYTYTVWFSKNPWYIEWDSTANEYRLRTVAGGWGFIRYPDNTWETNLHETVTEATQSFTELYWCNNDVTVNANSAEVYLKASEPIYAVEVFTPGVLAIDKERLTDIADGFRSSRGTTQKYTLDEMAVLAAEKTSGGGSMFASTASGRIPEYEKGTANSEFTLNFESSAIGALQEG